MEPMETHGQSTLEVAGPCSQTCRPLALGTNTGKTQPGACSFMPWLREKTWKNRLGLNWRYRHPLIWNACLRRMQWTVFNAWKTGWDCTSILGLLAQHSPGDTTMDPAVGIHSGKHQPMKKLTTKRSNGWWLTSEFREYHPKSQRTPNLGCRLDWSISFASASAKGCQGTQWLHCKGLMTQTEKPEQRGLQPDF